MSHFTSNAKVECDRDVLFSLFNKHGIQFNEHPNGKILESKWTRSGYSKDQVTAHIVVEGDQVRDLLQKLGYQPRRGCSAQLGFERLENGRYKIHADNYEFVCDPLPGGGSGQFPQIFGQAYVEAYVQKKMPHARITRSERGRVVMTAQQQTVRR